ncbi:hypothetical protein Rhe02_55580 [Rhizocola hellebori]|uniref:Terminase small subunit actinomycetes phage-type domain-containing protein n=1 Tax=Rhizocola hellebori TaxID=1392758 RepID=A0A8J3QDT4_9ACTN|nr:hypothetical protein Rhe02_55580 [Rhizocola hellebori]
MSLAVRKALDDETAGTPAAELALVYAARIDEATHVRLPLDRAMQNLRRACVAHPEMDKMLGALDKVNAALSAVSVAGELGPKLLASLDALLLTPKARSALKDKLPGGDAQPANPLGALRQEQDELKARRERNRAS